jgi:Mn2+/Fe2+ NRAMP family transporter
VAGSLGVITCIKLLKVQIMCVSIFARTGKEYGAKATRNGKVGWSRVLWVNAVCNLVFSKEF